MVFKKEPTVSGVGIGLRSPHLADILHYNPALPWLEVHPENFVTPSKQSLLREIAALYPLSFHGVGLSLGSPSLNTDHLSFLKKLVRTFNPVLFSEHVAWNQLEGVYYNDLFPMPYTDESLKHLAGHIRQVQETLEHSILIENPSQYIRCGTSTWREPDFMRALAMETGCRVLLDVNNIYVTCHNIGGDPLQYIRSFVGTPYVGELHVAGHETCIDPSQQMVLMDTHGAPVSADVWDLYEQALTLLGDIPTLVEWDTHIPPLQVLLNESHRAEQIRIRCHVAA